jgi:hypothetical protein
MAPKKIPFDGTGATIATIGYPVIEALIFIVVLLAYVSRRFPLHVERIRKRVGIAW